MWIKNWLRDSKQELIDAGLDRPKNLLICEHSNDDLITIYFRVLYKYYNICKKCYKIYDHGQNLQNYKYYTPLFLDELYNIYLLMQREKLYFLYEYQIMELDDNFFVNVYKKLEEDVKILINKERKIKHKKDNLHNNLNKFIISKG